MNAAQQKLVAIGVGVALVLIAPVGFFVIKPQLDNRSQAVAATEVIADEMTILSANRDELVNKRDSLPRAQKQVDELVKAFPPTLDQDAWFDMIAAAARSSGTTLLSVSVAAPVDPRGGTEAEPQFDEDGNPIEVETQPTFPIAQVEVNITGEGTIGQVAAFIGALAKMDRPLLISDVHVGPDSKDTSVSINGKTFMSRPLAEPTETDESDNSTN